MEKYNSLYVPGLSISYSEFYWRTRDRNILRSMPGNASSVTYMFNYKSFKFTTIQSNFTKKYGQI